MEAKDLSLYFVICSHLSRHTSAGSDRARSSSEQKETHLNPLEQLDQDAARLKCLTNRRSDLRYFVWVDRTQCRLYQISISVHPRVEQEARGTYVVILVQFPPLLLLVPLQPQGLDLLGDTQSVDVQVVHPSDIRLSLSTDEPDAVRFAAETFLRLMTVVQERSNEILV